MLSSKALIAGNLESLAHALMPRASGVKLTTHLGLPVVQRTT